MLKIIRWSKLFQIIAGIIILLLLNALLLGMLIKFAIIKGGEAAAGAKTEVSYLNLNILNGSLNIGRIQVANKKDPWKNLVDIGRITTKLNTEQLLYKRFVMDEMSITNVMLGTTRNSSGELKKPEPVTKDAKAIDFKKLAGSLQVDPAKTAKKIAEVGPLEAKNEIPKITKENEAKLDEATQKVNSYKPDEELKKVDLSELQNIDKVKSLTELQDKLKKIEEASKQISDIQKNFDATKSLADNNLKDVQKNLALITELKNKDLNKIYEKLDIGNYDLKSIGKSLLGPKINGYLDTGMGWLSMAQKYMPPKKPKAPKVKKVRFQGMNIVFAKKTTLPKFLIRLISLSGTTAQGQPNEINYSGKVLNLTSEPTLLGQPAMIDIRGRFTKNPKSDLKIIGTFDHTKDVSSDSFDFIVSGYKLDGQKLWDEKTIPLAIKKGTGIITGKVTLRDNALDGKISFIGRDLTYDKLIADKDSLESIAADAIRSAKEIKADIYLSGDLDSPDIKITTNLDKIISDRLNKVIGDKLEAVKKQITAEYEKQLGTAQKDIEAKVALQQQQIQTVIDKQQAAIEKSQKELQSKTDEINQQIDAQKNAVQGEAEKALQNVIPKKLF